MGYGGGGGEHHVGSVTQDGVSQCGIRDSFDPVERWERVPDKTDVLGNENGLIVSLGEHHGHGAAQVKTVEHVDSVRPLYQSLDLCPAARSPHRNRYPEHVFDQIEARHSYPATLSRRRIGRIRVPCFNLVEDVLGVPVPVWGPSGWAEIKRLVQWANAIHVLDCLYLSSAMAVLLCQRHGKPVLVSPTFGLSRYAFPPLT